MNPSIARNPSDNSVREAKKALRQTLLQARLQAAREPSRNLALAHRVDDTLQRYRPACIGFFWPLDGEFDARAAISTWLMGGTPREAALPVVVTRGAALEFHAWQADMPMKTGHHGIAEPTSERVLIPDLLLVPCVGFDADGYRLGYGGGYYDRTLAAWPAPRKPVTVGIAYEACRTAALRRETHDIPLDAIITETGTYPPQTA